MRPFFKFIERILILFFCGLFQVWHCCISPFVGQRCRFDPSCSQYAREALEFHGLFRGGYLSLKRIFRCNSLFPGGRDPVPSIKDD